MTSVNSVGFGKKTPWLGAACLIAVSSMAGFIGTLGFISKELMLMDLFALWDKHQSTVTLLILAIVLASLIKVAFSARLFLHLFRGPLPEPVSHHWHQPSAAIQAVPMFLASLILLFGLFPGLLDQPLKDYQVLGLHLKEPKALYLWHGFTPELALSTAILLLGFALYYLKSRLGWDLSIPPLLRFDSHFEHGILLFNKSTKLLTQALSADRPLHYIPILICALLLSLLSSLWATLLFWGPEIWAQLTLWKPNFLRSLTAGLIILAALGPLYLKRWTQQLLSLSAAGFLITFYFVLYRAPDLALTQMLIESAMLLLILLLLSRFPKSAQQGERDDQQLTPRNLFNLGIALGTGLLVTSLVLITQVRPSSANVGSLVLEQTLPLAKGTNAVNTVIIDFRAFDTLGEITVLLIAVLGAIGLVMRYKRSSEERRLAEFGPVGFGLPPLESSQPIQPKEPSQS
ncbi:MAG: DUF4040 domain-containing protein [Blastochloris sp.]|nr:DUF4040 domain-containing protein [Blastochloris sp.]